MKLAVTSLAALLLIASAAVSAHADTITLTDGTQVVGSVVHADAKGVDVETAGRKKRHFDKAAIRTIRFGDGEAARAIYATPEATLDTWRRAALAADDAGMVEAYASGYQAEVKAQLAQMSFVDREPLLAGLEGVTFEVKDEQLGADDATLTVAQTKDGDTRTGDIRFVLENGEWKMTP